MNTHSQSTLCSFVHTWTRNNLPSTKDKKVNQSIYHLTDHGTRRTRYPYPRVLKCLDFGNRTVFMRLRLTSVFGTVPTDSCRGPLSTNPERQRTYTTVRRGREVVSICPYPIQRDSVGKRPPVMVIKSTYNIR